MKVASAGTDGAMLLTKINTCLAKRTVSENELEQWQYILLEEAEMQSWFYDDGIHFLCIN